MDTNRKILGACIACLALFASGVSAQTIYKQVDEEGRVIFTDQPAPGARTITTFQTGRARAAAPAESSEWAPRAEASGRAMPRVVEPDPVEGDTNSRSTQEAERRGAADAPSLSRSTPMVPRMGSDEPRRASNWSPANLQSQQAQVTAAPPSAGATNPRSNYVDVERAVATYSPLNTPMAAQADAIEASRRARLDASKATGSPILVVQAAPRDQEPAAKKGEGMDTFYWIWALTFFALAGGLIYVGWQVFRLILGTAFPRWKVGVA
jgi:hypothetical protein